MEEHTASVELMTDRGFTVGAAIVDTFAVLKGQGAGKPMVAQLPADAGRFLIGAAAVTVVGVDPPWPANIPIGEITAVHLDEGSAGPTAELAPYADPAATEMVAVVLLVPGSSPEAPAITEPTETAVSELETGPGGG